ncbi:unannotated protein [freshwater metagenome]|uniref:Unannotated protein n=1 Tax=freshwater metagenome TaxID=449393 RepID=A0A6J7J5A4_9ZZZZ
MDTHDLIGEVQQEIATVIVGEQAREPVCPGRFLRCRPRCLEDTCGPSLGFVDEGCVGLLDRHASYQTAREAPSSCAIMAM